ncbi:MAG TPA: hypothetical protein VHO69_17895 [Phototrophicaceae bacterium]|nr:hypothetical protein [Phototrophicaceae bacterium]
MDIINEGDVIQIVADQEGDPRRIGRIGRVERIGVSPYWPEECEGILRAFIVPLDPNEKWTDWCLEVEVGLLRKASAAA